MSPTAEILRRLVARNGLLIVTTLLGVAAGWLYAAIRAPSYEASAYVVLTPSSPSVADSTAVSFAQAYGRITTQGGVLRTAVAIAGERSEDSLRRAVRVSTSPDAPMVRVTGSAGTASQAAARANAVATALIAYGNQRSARTRVRLDSFADASPPADPTSPRPALDMAVGGAAGLLVGGLAIAAGAGRRTARGGPAGAEPPADGPYHWAVPAQYARRGTGNGAEPAPKGEAGGAADGIAAGAGPAGDRAAAGSRPSDPPDAPGGEALTVPVRPGATGDRTPASGRDTGRP
jgi:capsular polysaccharide biosynthesis protein